MKFFPQGYVKYESLGNAFILVDIPENNYEIKSVKTKTDGTLFLKKNKSVPEIFMFNSDGSNGNFCVNGARCVAHYLYTKHNFPPEFELCMGSKKIKNKIEKLGDKIFVTQFIDIGTVLGKKSLKTKAETFTGYMVDVGNPHFIIFKKQNVTWLSKNGHLIENHKEFENRTNIEFVWGKYNSIVYERGCGVTKACGSGMAAITTLLFFMKKIELEEKIKIRMPGGEIESFVSKNKKISLVSSEINLVLRPPPEG
jgi:diaminopimelate epimerase